jgi:hypothetical protein
MAEGKTKRRDPSSKIWYALLWVPSVSNQGFGWQKQLLPSIHPINCSKSGRQVYSAIPGEAGRSSFISQSEEGKGWLIRINPSDS